MPSSKLQLVGRKNLVQKMPSVDKSEKQLEQMARSYKTKYFLARGNTFAGLSVRLLFLTIQLENTFWQFAMYRQQLRLFFFACFACASVVISLFYGFGFPS
eukprot:m.231642 g.231642  ORF g.231642 m.231642 type:complete len:101 (+) comp26466_c1_seq18:3922-4224(+)